MRELNTRPHTQRHKVRFVRGKDCTGEKNRQSRGEPSGVLSVLHEVRRGIYFAWKGGRSLEVLSSLGPSPDRGP